MFATDNGPHSGQALRDRRRFQVRARHLIAEVEQHLGDAAHADAADSHKMDALDFCKHAEGELLGYSVMALYASGTGRQRCDFGSCIGMGKAARRLGHCSQALPIAQQFGNLTYQAIAGKLRLP
jgi:hypothetical protein